MTAVEWLDTLSPWPRDGFGVDRMRELLAELGDPQQAYPAIHVVGTNGKSTATVTIEQVLLAEGLSTGATISPHVTGWSERIRVDGEEADFEHAVSLVREAAERLHATQFEIVSRHVSEVTVVPDSAAIEALLELLREEKLLVEPAASCALAALLNGKIRVRPGETVVVVLCGANVLLEKVFEWSLQDQQPKEKHDAEAAKGRKGRKEKT